MAGNYSSVRTLIAIDNPVLRKGLGDAFRHLGCGTVEVASAADHVRTSLGQSAFDLIVMTTDMDGDFVSQYVADMRNGRLGDHPFAVVIMLLAVADQDHIRRVIDCGPDDLLLLPVSPKQLLARVEALGRSRKPFVVTQDFIGPDRRKEPRPERTAIPLIEVPNPLKARLAAVTPVLLQSQIDQATGRLNALRLERDIAQIQWLYDGIGKTLGEGDVDSPKVRSLLQRLQDVCKDVLGRVPDAGATDLPGLAAAVTAAANGLAAAGAAPGEPARKALEGACARMIKAIKTRLGG